MRSKRRLQIGGIVNRMRPRVRPEELEVTGEALFKICSESVIHGAAVRVVGDPCRRKARNCQSGWASDGSHDAFKPAACKNAVRQRNAGRGRPPANEGLKPGRTEKVHQCCRNVGLRRSETTPQGANTVESPVPTNSGLLGKFGLVGPIPPGRRHRCPPVFYQQIATGRVRVDRPVQVASAVEVVGEAESEPGAEISFKTEIDLL